MEFDHGQWRKSSYSTDGEACIEIDWRKSSFSSETEACVEVAWRKSSHSNDGADCVEVAYPVAARVGIRDSKNPTAGHLTLPTNALHHLIATCSTN